MADVPESRESVTYQLFIVLVSVLAMLLLAIDAMVRLGPATTVLFHDADTILCGFFLFDFIVSFVKARRKLRYMTTWGWLDLLSGIPLIGVLRIARLGRVVRILRVLRGIRSARELTSAILQHRAQSALLAAGLLAIIVVLFSSIAILQFEDTPRGNIKDAEDALWWSTATLTTTGSGDRYPVTPEGQTVSIILNIAGVALLGTLSGFFASWFLDPDSRRRESELDELRREIQNLRETLEKER